MKVNTFYKQKRKKEKWEEESWTWYKLRRIQRNSKKLSSLNSRPSNMNMKGIGEGRGKNQEEGMGAEQLELVEYRLGQWEEQGWWRQHDGENYNKNSRTERAERLTAGDKELSGWKKVKEEIKVAVEWEENLTDKNRQKKNIC